MGLRLRQAARVFRAMLLQFLLSGAVSGVLVALATLGLRLTTQSQLVNLLLEPFSLLFIPGVAIAMLWGAAGHLQKNPKPLADNHDFSTTFVLLSTLAFYFAMSYWLFSRFRRARTLTGRASSA